MSASKIRTEEYEDTKIGELSHHENILLGFPSFFLFIFIIYLRVSAFATLHAIIERGKEQEKKPSDVSGVLKRK